MAKKRSNAEQVRERRRIKREKQQKRTDLIAYIIAGVAVLAMVAVLIIAFL